MNPCSCCAEAAPYCLITALSDSRRSNNGSWVEMSQLTVYHSCAEYGTWDGRCQMPPINWQGILLESASATVLRSFLAIVCFAINMPVTHSVPGENCDRLLKMGGGQLVSSWPAVCLHLPQYLQHMSGSVNMAQCPGACWPEEWEDEGWGGTCMCLSVA